MLRRHRFSRLRSTARCARALEGAGVDVDTLRREGDRYVERRRAAARPARRGRGDSVGVVVLERAWHGHASIADRLRCTYPMSAMTTGDPSHVGDAPGCQSRSRTAQITPARQCQCRYAGNPCLVLTLPAPESAHDHCPLCQADLGKPRGATRRRIVFTATPGTFRWQCPDCRGVWQVDTRVAARA